MREKEIHVSNEPMSVEQIGDVLASGGNHELKAFLLISMQPGTVYDRDNIGLLLSLPQGENPVWSIDRKIGWRYCEKSLSEIALVTTDVTGTYGNIEGYRITELGEQVKPVYARLLAWELEGKNPSLQDVWGKTPSRREDDSEDNTKRAPLRRFKILSAVLETRKAIQVKDLAELIGEDRRVVVPHLEKLDELGFLTYESRPAEGSYSFYRVKSVRPEVPPAYPELSTLTFDVFNFMFDGFNSRLSPNEITMILKDPEETISSSYTEVKEKVLYDQVCRVLQYLADLGYVEVEKFDEERQSNIFMTRTQRRRTKELLEIVDGFRNHDEANVVAGYETASSLPFDKVSVRRLFSKAREASPQADKIPVEETKMRLCSVVIRHPQCTSREAGKYLRLEEKVKLSPKRVANLLLELLREDSLTRTGSIKNPHYQQNAA